MLPSQSKALMETLKEQLRAIQKAINEQISAVRSTSESQERAWRDIPKLIVEAQERAANQEKAATEAEGKKNRRVQWVIAVGTWFAFFAAVVAAAGAWYYARIARDQLRTSDMQLSEMEAHARLDERAWVFVRNVAPNKGCPWKAIDFVNSGRTPALDFSIRAGFKPVPKGEPPDPEETQIPGRGTVAPSGMVSSCIGNSNIDKAADWSKRDLFVHGRLSYSDVFGTSHWTTFCFRRDSDGNFTACESGSDMDRNGIPGVVKNP